MSDEKEQSNASEILNWDHLVKIADGSKDEADNLPSGLAIFAYDFTSTADEGRRNVMLVELLENATANQSRETAEKVVEAMAKGLRTDHQQLRKYAKQNGIRLKRG